ncbi:hypothetical protein BGX38DRAFT_1266354 [Terfezia claveryi]|nr:hypothetical protein BGX38DRAFT_1266354 [Terfezia claveryi]
MFAGLLFITITKGLHGELHAVEAYLMLIFCMGGVCTGNSVDNVHDYDHGGGGESGDARGIGSTVVETGYAYLETSTLGGYVRLLLACGFIAYGLWFVFVGIDGMFNAFPDDCKYAFFLARLDLSGRFREFLKALFILVAIPALVSLTKGAATLARATYFIFNQGRQGEANTQTPLPSIEIKTSSVSEYKEQPDSQHIITRLLGAILSGTLLVFIIAVELTIRWNKIEGVQAIGSTGQLLPVIIGVGGVVRVLMRLISDNIARHKKKGLRRMVTTSGSGDNGPVVTNHVSEAYDASNPAELVIELNNLGLEQDTRKYVELHLEH